MIYEIVKFLWEQARQILEFIDGATEAVAAIAKGQIGGAAQLVESALAKALPLVIGFPASLLNINGLAAKVQDFIKSLRKKFSDTVDKVLDKAKEMAHKLFTARKGRKSAKRQQSRAETVLDSSQDALEERLRGKRRKRD